MRIRIAMAQLGYAQEAATLVSWLKHVGERVERGEPIVEVETEKTTAEMEALDSGTLVEIIRRPGEIVRPGEVIGYLES